jgi:DNA primase large subunit
VKVEKRTPIAARQSLLSLYDEPPQEELTLDEFEMFSLERLQLLRSIELLKAKNGENESFNREVYEVNHCISLFFVSIEFSLLMVYS